MCCHSWISSFNFLIFLNAFHLASTFGVIFISSAGTTQSQNSPSLLEHLSRASASISSSRTVVSIRWSNRVVTWRASASLANDTNGKSLQASSKERCCCCCCWVEWSQWLTRVSQTCCCALKQSRTWVSAARSTSWSSGWSPLEACLNWTTHSSNSFLHVLACNAPIRFSSSPK